MDKVNEYLKLWPVMTFVVTTAVALITQWTLLSYRIQSIEDRQDRQGTTIMTIQTQLQAQATDNARIEAKVDAIDNNVDYIRGRIDRAIQ